MDPTCPAPPGARRNPAALPARPEQRTATHITWLWTAAVAVAVGPLVLTAAGLITFAVRPVPQVVTETAHLPPALPVPSVVEMTSVADGPTEPGEPRPLPRGCRQPTADVPAGSAEPIETGKCNRFGTQIDFVGAPSIAFDRAGREGKLVLVLHLAGHFEDPGFT